MERCHLSGNMYLYNIHSGGGGGGLVTKLCPTLATPWTVACQAPLNMGILQARILKRVAISFSRNFEGKVGFSDQVDIWGI